MAIYKHMHGGKPMVSQREFRLRAQALGVRNFGEPDADVAAYRNIMEAEVFAKECGESVQVWFDNADIADDAEWQAARRLFHELLD